MQCSKLCRLSFKTPFFYSVFSFYNNSLKLQDGGCTCPGDVAKAFAGGADFVMLGGMLAGHDQSGGELKVKSDGTKVKLFYGMSSSTAMQKHAGGIASYRY